MEHKKKKRFNKNPFVFVFVAVFLLLGSGNHIVVKAANHTRDEAVSWASSQIGKGLDYDGAYGNQCVDLIKYYYAYFGYANYAMGNANAYISNNLPPGWSRVYSGFQPGDIAVWKVNHSCATCNTGVYGHVGIITSADAVGFNAVNQNFSGKSYCTQNWFYCSALACAIRPAYTNGNNPQGCLDLVRGEKGSVFVGGWAFDKDNVGQAIEVHVYIGGPAGSGEGHVIKADAYRNDVNKAYGCGDYHGISSLISTNRTGNQEVYVYAINIGGGTDNTLLGHKTASISPIPTAVPSPTPAVTPAPVLTPVPTSTESPEANNTNDTEFRLDPKSSLKIQDGEILSGISAASNTANEVAEQFLNDVNSIVFKDAKGNTLGRGEKVGTGSEIILLKDGKEIQKLTAVVSGDLNGDGTVGNKDVSILARIFLGKMEGSKVQGIAGDINGDGAVGNKDIALLARKILGKG